MTDREKAIMHLKTILKHKKEVAKCCFKMGIPWQGVTHDLSKFTPSEFGIYKYYDGSRSPHEVAREVLGYSPYWMFHRNRNKHHWEFWLDNEKKNDWTPIKMPYKYVIEMFCDFVGAGKAYQKTKWTLASAWEYHSRCKANRLFEAHTLYLIEKLLWNLKEASSEEAFYAWYKQAKHYLKNCYEDNILDY